MRAGGCAVFSFLLCLGLLPAAVPATGPAVAAPAPQDREEFQARVEADYREALALWDQDDRQGAIDRLEALAALPGVGDLGRARALILYRVGGWQALLGRTDAALATLREAVRAGFSDPERLLADPDLESVRAADGFQLVLAQARAAARRWSSPVFESPYAEDLGVDEKLAGLARLWAEVKYGFAFFDQVPDVDWDGLFVAAIPEVRATGTTAEYYRVLMRLCARLRDAHTRVEAPDALYRRLFSRPAIDTRLIDGRVYVTAVLDDSLRGAGLRPGLEVVSIDGIPVREYAEARVAPYFGASTPQAADVMTYGYYLLCGAPDRDVSLELRDEAGAARQATLPRSYHRILSTEPFSFRILDGDIGYVAINGFGSRSQVAAFDSVFSELAATDALIIDLRRNTGGNGAFAYDILAHLTSEPFPTLSCRAPVYEALDREQGRPQGWDEQPPKTWPPAAGCYAKPVAVLIGPETGSAAEDFCSSFAAIGRGPLIGRPTAGSTGQALHFALPGGGSAQVCTRACAGPDGTEFVGIGIQPDLAVSTTAADLRAGRDAQLQAALDELRGKRAD